MKCTNLEHTHISVLLFFLLIKQGKRNLKEWHILSLNIQQIYASKYLATYYNAIKTKSLMKLISSLGTEKGVCLLSQATHFVYTECILHDPKFKAVGVKMYNNLCELQSDPICQVISIQ